MLRQLRRHRAFAGTLIAVLAVGVAVTTAMFSVVYGVLLRELPYPDADRLVALASTDPRIPEGRLVAGAADYYDWRARQQVFENLAMVRPVTTLNLTGSGEPERLAAARVTASLCDTLGVTPILGPLLHGGRGARTGARVERRHPEPRAVAAPLRRRSLDRRSNDSVERPRP